MTARILLLMAACSLSTPLCLADPVTVNAGESAIFSFDFIAAGVIPAPPYESMTFVTGKYPMAAQGGWTAYSEINGMGTSWQLLFGLALDSAGLLWSGTGWMDGLFSVQIIVTSGSLTVDPYAYGGDSSLDRLTDNVYPTCADVLGNPCGRSPTPTPEPSTLTLIAVGVVGLIGYGSGRRISNPR